MISFFPASLGLETFCWVLNLAMSCAGLFLSIFMYISHDDLRHYMLEPLELSGYFN